MIYLRNIYLAYAWRIIINHMISVNVWSTAAVMCSLSTAMTATDDLQTFFHRFDPLQSISTQRSGRYHAPDIFSPFDKSDHNVVTARSILNSTLNQLSGDTSQYVVKRWYNPVVTSELASALNRVCRQQKPFAPHVAAVRRVEFCNQSHVLIQLCTARPCDTFLSLRCVICGYTLHHIRLRDGRRKSTIRVSS